MKVARWLMGTFPSPVFRRPLRPLSDGSRCGRLAAGRHVLVAKPITNNCEEAAELVADARNRNLTLAVVQQIRCNRHYVAVRRFIQSGSLGRVEAA